MQFHEVSFVTEVYWQFDCNCAKVHLFINNNDLEILLKSLSDHPQTLKLCYDLFLLQSIQKAKSISVDSLKYSKDQSESVTQKQTWDKFAAA